MKSGRFLIILWCVLILAQIAAAKDVWVSVRSKNFNLVGNADEKDIRRVAVRLEQFREVLRRLLPASKFNSFTPTTVVVFKNRAAYQPYLPLLQNGQADTGIVGYFQAGDDVNYITLSTDSEDDETYRTIFHEYTHFIVNNNLGRSDVPPWINEGLAEYYETFHIEKDQEAHFGGLHQDYLSMLQREKLIPFDEFLSIDNFTLHNRGDHGRTIFYAQAWALTHYLQQGNGGARRGQTDKYLNALKQGKSAKDAFQTAFQTDYASMEKELKDYIARRSFSGTIYTFKEKLTFDAQMQTAPLPEAEADAYLGDLLLHSQRFDEAKAKLNQAVALDDKLPLAYIALGATLAKQKKFAEAEKILEKAVALDPQNYLSHFTYGYALSEATMDENHLAVNVSEEKTEKMRSALKKSIELNPNFPEAYSLLGFADLISGKELEDGVKAVQKALVLEPGNQNHALILCQLFAQQGKYEEAQTIAAKLETTAEDEQMRSTAATILKQIRYHIAYQKEVDEINRANEKAEKEGRETVVEVTEDDALTPDESLNRAINQSLRKPAAGELRVLGFLTSIDCAKEQIFVVRGEKEVLKFRTADLQTVQMTAFTPEMDKQPIGCGARKNENFVVVTYRPNSAKSKTDGEIVALEFVPKNFKLLP